MAGCPPPVTMITCSMPLAMASSTPYWIVGLSTSGSISFGCALVTGRNRVPSPAAGKIAFLTGGIPIRDNLSVGSTLRPPAGTGGTAPAGRRGRSHHPACRRRRDVRDAGDDRPDGDNQPPLGGTSPARRPHHGRL